MQRLTEAWLEFCGVRCDAAGLTLMEMPSRPFSAKRGSTVAVPGRDGFLWLPEEASEGVSLSAVFETTDAFTPAGIAQWLSGAGLLRISDEPDRAWQAVCVEEAESVYRYLRFRRQTITVPFLAQPYRYHYPAVNEFSCTNGGTVVNPGSGASRPRVRVAGTGAGTVTIGGEMMEISNIGGLLYIDSDAMEATDGGGNLRNDRLTMDEFPLLAPGVNYVQWSGGVTDVRILPRYRDRA